MRPSGATVLALLLAGCPYIGKELHDLNMGTDTDPTETFAVTSVEPTFGTSGLAQPVTVWGGPFDPDEPEDYAVWFGADRAEIVTVHEDRIEVLTPTTAPEGTVDVEVVEAGDFTDGVEAAFRFWPDNSGKAGITGRFAWFAQPEGTTSFGTVWLSFLEPTAFTAVQQYTPRINSCVDILDYLPQYDVLRPADRLTVRAANDAVFELDLSAGTYIGAMDAGTWTSPWSLEALPASDTFPSIALETLVEAAPVIELLTPDLTTTPTIYQNAFYVEWTPSTTNTGFVHIMVETYMADGTQLQVVQCTAEDTGRFRVSPTVFTQWQAGMEIIMGIGRMHVGGDPLPHDQSRNEVAGVTYVVGEAVAR